MNRFYLWGISFEYLIFKDISEEKLLDLIEIIKKISEENIIFISNIFSSYKNKNIETLLKIIPSNIIYSRENNNFNIYLLFINKKNNKFLFSQIDNFWFLLENKKLKILALNGLKFNKLWFKEQTKEIYDYLSYIINNYWFEYNSICRARNYIEDILTNYKEFNIIRDNFFENNLILKNFPAWTWIGCILDSNYKHSASFLLLKSNFIDNITIYNNEIQCEASNYWPKFSRWKLLKSKIDNNDILFVSWTSAVNSNWESIYIDDIDKNILFTLKSLQNLLYNAWMDFNNLKTAFVYLKYKKYRDNFRRIYKENWFTFDYIETYWDICRDDFLFEIEAIAIKKY